MLCSCLFAKFLFCVLFSGIGQESIDSQSSVPESSLTIKEYTPRDLPADVLTDATAMYAAITAQPFPTLSIPVKLHRAADEV